MKGISMNQVTAGARKGVFSHLAELHHRIRDFYAVTPAILDIFLGHLREPSSGLQPDVNQRFCAYLSLLAVLQVAEACKTSPALCLLTARKLVPALGGIVAWIYLVLCLERDQWCEGYPYGFQGVAKYEDLVYVLLGIAGIDEAVESAVVANDLVIDLSVMAWVAAPHGHPLLYASGNHLSAEYSDGPEEPTISLLHLLADKNPKGLGDVILNGRICAPERFFVRASQRMWTLVKPSVLPHLHHVSEVPTEDLNFTRVVGVVKALVDALPELAVPMLETMLPAYFMDALVKASGRSCVIECRSGRMDYLVNLLELAVHVAGWAGLRSGSFVPTAKSLISGGIVQLLGACTFLSEDRPESVRPFRILTQLVMNWATSPNLFKRVSSAMSAHLFWQPGESEPDEDSANVKVIEMALWNYGVLSRSWGKPARLRPCDNLAHRLKSEEVEPTDGGACSRCHSVVYCSPHCQTQDWYLLHRYECRAMRSEYLRGGYPSARFSLNSRTFQTTVLRSFYASHAQDIPGDGKQVMMVNLSLDEPVWFLSLPDYTRVMRSAIPGHLAKRLERVVEMFIEFGLGMSSGGSTVGSVGLVHGTFRFAQDAEVGILALFRKSRLEDDSRRASGLASCFDVEASLVYHIQERSQLSEVLKLIPAPVSEGEVEAVRPVKDKCAIYDCRIAEERQIHCHCEECNAEHVCDENCEPCQ